MIFVNIEKSELNILTNVTGDRFNLIMTTTTKKEYLRLLFRIHQT